MAVFQIPTVRREFEGPTDARLANTSKSLVLLIGSHFLMQLVGCKKHAQSLELMLYASWQ